MLYHHKAGFTLVELAIVLVIIGLIISGILVGRDMIRAAEIRATISQKEKYDAAVNVFRNKYGGMPGDLLSSIASKYGFVTRNGAVGHGDGDGMLSPCGNHLNAGCETLLFWRDLADAGLIPGPFTYLGANGDQLGQNLTASTMSTAFPPAKLGRGNYFVVYYGDNGHNYYELTGIDHTDNSGIYYLNLSLTPAEAYAIDSKMDDGTPLGGKVTASDFAYPSQPYPGALSVAATPTAPAAGVCVSNAAGSPYNAGTQAFADTPSCELMFILN